MHGDFTRDTFDPSRLYSRVLKQQGRVDLDADWNELVAILLHAQRQGIKDALGYETYPPTPPISHGTRADTGNAAQRAAFQVTPHATDPTYELKPGTYYVEGLRCDAIERQELSDSLVFDPATGSLSKGAWANPTLIVLDVWEQHVSALEGELAELALKGADSTTRARVNFRVIGVAALRDAGLVVAQLTNAGLAALYRVDTNRMPQMYATVNPPPSPSQKCEPAPAGGFQGIDNYLYRVEIHTGFVQPTGSPKLPARFKWARDNGSSIFPIKEIRVNNPTQGTTAPLDVSIDVEAIPRLYRERLQVGKWVEILDDKLTEDGLPGCMLQIRTVNLLERTLKLVAHPDANKPAAAQPGVIAGKQPYRLKSYPANEPDIHPLLRLWDHTEEKDHVDHLEWFGTMKAQSVKQADLQDPQAQGQGAGAVVEPTREQLMELERGLHVIFLDNNPGEPSRWYRPGDYWLIPARAETANILWIAGDVLKRFRAPDGVKHYYAPLALKSVSPLADLRRLVLRTIEIFTGAAREVNPTIAALTANALSGGANVERPEGALALQASPMEVSHAVSAGATPAANVHDTTVIVAANTIAAPAGDAPPSPALALSDSTSEELRQLQDELDMPGLVDALNDLPRGKRPADLIAAFLNNGELSNAEFRKIRHKTIRELAGMDERLIAQLVEPRNVRYFMGRVRKVSDLLDRLGPELVRRR